MFNAKDAPQYRPGIRAVLAIFVALAACTILQLANLVWLNRMQERKRVKNGKPAKLVDRSMENKYHDLDDTSDDIRDSAEAGANRTRIGEQAFLDLTDRKNDEFVYIY